MSGPQERLDALNEPGLCAFCKRLVTPNEESGMAFCAFYQDGFGLFGPDGPDHRYRFEHPESVLLITRCCDECSVDLSAASLVGEATRLIEGGSA
jgi:hypothetical protein